MLVEPDHPDMLAHRSMDEIAELWPNYGTTFAFVRNPYDRLVSIFHFTGQDAKRRLNKRSNNADFADIANIPIESDLKVYFQYTRGFEHWIKNTSIDDNAFPALKMLNNKHIETQTKWLSGVMPDIVVKLENMDTEFVKIQDLLKCYAPPIHTNTSLHGDYRDYYNDETRAIATQWLEEDLDNFKYVF
jgi:hypothetical protein